MGDAMNRFTAVSVLSFAVLIHAADCGAEEIKPAGTEWSFERKTGGGAETCNLILSMFNAPVSPESVNVHFLVGVRGNASVFGFTVDVGDIVFSGGRPQRIDKVPIQSAAILSETFNSPGRMYSTDAGDGGLAIATPDPVIATQMLTVAIGGDFKIAFTRDGGRVSREYIVHQQPSPADLQQFTACTMEALPH